MDQNTEHSIATRGARLHHLEMDTRWNILHPFGLSHPIAGELWETLTRLYLESTYGEQTQTLRLDPHTKQNSHGRQSTITKLAAPRSLHYVQWTSRIRTPLKPTMPFGKRSMEPYADLGAL